tara:strand:- start:5405 stop:6283 length:879 start_codon:yes stop_codon:yes gene_type:complete
MNYEYINIGPVTINDGEWFPTPQRPKIKITDDNGNFAESPMVYTNEAIDYIKSKKVVLSAYESTTGQGKVHDDYRNANQDKVWRDDVYMAGSLSRQDISISTTEGSEIVDKLEAGWADFIPNYKLQNVNLVSEFIPLRPPYVNNSISFYDMNLPTDDLKEKFGFEYNEYLNWYGLKFDKTTLEVTMKAVLPMGEMQRAHPTIASNIEQLIPVYGNHFFAVMHNQSKEMNPNVDVYFQVSHENGSQWCRDMELAIPYTDESLNSKLWIWGAVYNTEMKKITHVKAYIRNYLEE